MDGSILPGLIGALVGIIILLIFGSILFVFQRKKKSDGGGGNDLLLLQNQIQDMRAMLDTRLSDSRQEMQNSMSESTKIIREVTKNLAELRDTNRQVVSFADQLQSLQDILKNPKQRGTLGEYYLETVLGDVFAPSGYQMQYHFENGDIVDAIIYLDRDKILPIDSKFSLENYNKLIEVRPTEDRERLEKMFRQDLKNRIDETSKYIRPKEGTMDFAFMFIPSEAIYYDLLIGKVGGRDLIEYAFQKKQVIIVSPTSFMAYLQTVRQGLRSLQIEESAKEIRKHVESLGKHIMSHDNFMNRLGSSLQTTVNHYNTAHKELFKMDKDVARITGKPSEMEVLPVEGPHRAED